MPTYDHQCPAGHEFDRFCSIRARDAEPTPPCPECGEPAIQVIKHFPHVNNTEVCIMDYPGSKVLKAGYVGSHVDPGVKKVSAGYGGALNPSTRPVDPVVKAVAKTP